MQHQTRGTLTLYTPNGRRKYLTPDERARLLVRAWSHPRHDVGTLILFLAYTGCRISEALNMCAGAIDTVEGFAAIRSLKKRGQVLIRTVPLPEYLIVHLRTVHDLDVVPAEARLWHWSRGRAWFLVRQAMGEANIGSGPHATPKGLRHGFGIHATRSGVPLNLIQRWLGHVSIATTAIYADALGAEERELASRMWREAAGGGSPPRSHATSAQP